MKKTIKLTAIALALTSSLSFAGGDGWMTDFAAAKKKAATEHKNLLVDFTGSDWCSWCIRLKKEVFNHKEFTKGVADKYILVEIDFPQNKSKQSEAVQKQNKELQKTYKIQGFPTVLLMDATGKPYAKTGYQKGGPKAYLKHLSKLQNTKTTLDANLKKAKNLKGVEKAKALAAAVETIPEELMAYYKSITDEIVKLDPKDESGFAKAQKTREEIKGFQQKVATAMRSGKGDSVPAMIDKFITDHKLSDKKIKELKDLKLQIQVHLAIQKGDTPTAIKAIDAYKATNKLDPEELKGLNLFRLNIQVRAEKDIAKANQLIDTYITNQKLTGMDKQEVLTMKIDPLLTNGKFDETEKLLDTIIAVDPSSDLAKQLLTFKPKLKEMKEAAAKKAAAAKKVETPAKKEAK